MPCSFRRYTEDVKLSSKILAKKGSGNLKVFFSFFAI